MTEKKKNKFVNLPGELYDHLLQSAKKDFTRPDETVNVSGYITKLLLDCGYDSDDVKIVFRVPKDIADDPIKLREFLTSRINHAVQLI